MIEEALLAHPKVLGAAAIERPDRHAGEVPVAYIVTADPEMPSTRAELMAHAFAAIDEPAARPKRIHSIAAIPVTEVGKHFKPALIADAAGDVLSLRRSTRRGLDRRPGVTSAPCTSRAGWW